MPKPKTKPPLRKGLPKKTKKKSAQGVTLFTFISDITFDKKDILNKDNVHVYSQFMIVKWLSMYEGYLPLVDHLNRLCGVLDDYQFHKLCIALVPKNRIRLNFVKGVPDMKSSKDKVKYIQDYFQVSPKEAYDYYKLAGEELVDNIKKMYGIM
jgi:hypothetical protein